MRVVVAEGASTVDHAGLLFVLARVVQFIGIWRYSGFPRRRVRDAQSVSTLRAGRGGVSKRRYRSLMHARAIELHKVELDLCSQ